MRGVRIHVVSEGVLGLSVVVVVFFLVVMTWCSQAVVRHDCSVLELSGGLPLLGWLTKSLGVGMAARGAVQCKTLFLKLERVVR